MLFPKKIPTLTTILYIHEDIRHTSAARTKHLVYK